ncbi:MAG: hypothetical protein Q9225_001250 [Loekoesia sp. 1 TL-2023]
MAAEDQLTLSSSPVRRTASTTTLQMSKTAISSSPGLPSPSQILMGKITRPKNGSAAVSVPNDINTGFTSGSSLVQIGSLDDGIFPTLSDGNGISKAKNVLEDMDAAPPRVAEKDLKRRQEIGRSGKAKGSRQTGLRPKSKASPDSAAAQVNVNPIEEGSTSRSKNRKKPQKGDQSTIRKTKIIKPGAGTAAQKRSKKIDTAAAPEHQDGGCKEQRRVEEDKERQALWTEHGLGLAEALKRRKDWTPTKRIVGEADPLNEVEAAWSGLIPLKSPSSGKPLDAGLGKLVENFRYADADKASLDKKHASRSFNEECLTKRRKLDLVAGIASPTSRIVPTKRSKSPKKKPQTITDKAMAPFIPEGLANTSIRSYFAPPSNAKPPFSSPVFAAEEGDAKDEEKVTSSRPVKAIKKKGKTPKTMKRPVILLSPESAMETANQQDLLFGTYSQLAREESPTFVRNLQQAVRESESLNDSQSSAQGNESQISLQSNASNVSNSKLPTASRNLWAVAARDNAGSLLDVDIVDLINTPQPSRSLSTVAEVPSKQELIEDPSGPTEATVDGGSKIVEDITNVELAASPAIDQHQNDSMLPRSVVEASLRERPKSRSPVKNQRRQKDSEDSMTETSLLEMPNYNGFANVDLQKAVAAFGFKPIKPREEIIPLLKLCWKTKNRIALQSLPPNIPATSKSTKALPKELSESGSPKKKRGRPPKKTSAECDNNDAKIYSLASPKKPRGRPRKITATQSPRPKTPAEEIVDEISDTSGVTSTPSPRRRTSAKPPQPLTLVSSLPAIASPHDKEALFAAITEAITSYPPTHDAKNLTWYEKMLLYDPIIIEDLAVWLNKEGLGRVGCNEKISPSMAKQWCESQSVCCLWKDSLKGGKRARY